MSLPCPTKEQILAASKESVAIKAALQKLFPTAFVEKHFDLSPLGKNMKDFYAKAQEIGFMESPTDPAIQVRALGEYRNKGLYLSNKFNWEIVVDDDCNVLIPTRKV